MTSQEARQQIDACERQITGAYSNLEDAARSMGEVVVEEAASNTTKKTMMPLIISLIGLILVLTQDLGAGMLGVIMIIVGIVVAYNAHKSAASIQQTIENQQKNFFNILSNNSKI